MKHYFAFHVAFYVYCVSLFWSLQQYLLHSYAPLLKKLSLLPCSLNCPSVIQCYVIKDMKDMTMFIICHHFIFHQLIRVIIFHQLIRIMYTIFHLLIRVRCIILPSIDQRTCCDMCATIVAGSRKNHWRLLGSPRMQIWWHATRKTAIIYVT